MKIKFLLLLAVNLFVQFANCSEASYDVSGAVIVEIFTNLISRAKKDFGPNDHDIKLLSEITKELKTLHKYALSKGDDLAEEIRLYHNLCLQSKKAFKVLKALNETDQSDTTSLLSLLANILKIKGDQDKLDEENLAFKAKTDKVKQ